MNKREQNEEIETRIGVTRETLKRLRALRPAQNDAADFSHIAKLPLKVVDLRSALNYRIVDLLESGLHASEENRIASCVVLVRSALETAAALWYITDKVETALSSGAIGDLDDFVMRVLLGSKVPTDDTRTPEAINTLTFIDKIDKKAPGFRKIYDDMSEYAHPNWLGAGYLYAQPSKEDLVTRFGPEFRDPVSARFLASLGLEISSHMFEALHAQIEELIPRFIELAEKDIAV
jgi:hypothetical protein